jgi:AcrR family transcriptional regulator
MMYRDEVPRLWNETIDAHRAAVRDATLNATAALVAEHGLTAVTMSQIAKETGIGRATLYKYFPDVESILLAWHERQIGEHLQQLADVHDHTGGDPAQRLEAVLTAYALIAHQRRDADHDADLAALLHRGEHLTRAQRHLTDFLTTLLAEGAATGDLRDDIAPAELAAYCLHALTAASGLPNQAAVHRLVALTLTGLRPEH